MHIKLKKGDKDTVIKKNKNRELARRLWNNKPIARILPDEWRLFSSWVRTPSSQTTLVQIGLPDKNFATWIADNSTCMDLITRNLPTLQQLKNIQDSINQYQQKASCTSLPKLQSLTSS